MLIDTSPLKRHEKVGLLLSGGKDSVACVYLLRDYLDRITIYHWNTGDLLPEIQDVVSEVELICPNFVHMQGDVRGWIAENGYPTDLLPYSSHPLGVAAGQNDVKLVTRYECCFTNLMWPMFDRVRSDGNTLCIRGTKKADLKRLPAQSGEVGGGVELWFPIADWSHADVFSYLKSVNAPISKIYDHVTNSPECARCSAWWGEGRAAYMKDRHPELYREYMHDLRVVADELAPTMAHLTRELTA